MSRKRKGPAQSGQPRKRVLKPITAESVPYTIENEPPSNITQESQKAEIDPQVKGQRQNSLETSLAARGGHSKGLPKPPVEPDKPKRPRGRPLKLGPIEERLDLATEAFLLLVIEGKDIAQSGSTGKRFLGPASLVVRTKAAELWIQRRRPVLSQSQQAVVADIRSEVRVESVSNRELAQSVMRVLGRADVSEVEQAIETKKLVAPTGEATGGEADISGVAPSCKFPEEPLDPNHGHKVEALNGTGAYLRYFGPEHGHGGKWSVFNSANVSVGLTPRWDKAVSILMNTKPTNEIRHPDPFELDERTDEFAQGRMERAARQPRVVTRRGR